MAGGAPVGNHNAIKGKEWADAIRRAIRAKYGKEWQESVQELAGKLVEAADAGDPVCLKEIGDRLDGKPKQSMDLEVSGSLIDLLREVNERITQQRAPALGPPDPVEDERPGDVRH